MSKKLDNLFKEKLDSRETNPGPQAWQTLEDHLLRKKRKVLYRRLSVAASLLILISLGFLFFDRLHTDSGKEMISERTNTPETEKTIVDSLDKEQAPLSANDKKQAKSEEPENDTFEKKDTSLPTVTHKKSSDPSPEDVKIIDSDGSEALLVDNIQLPVNETVAKEASNDKKLPPITIEYRTSSNPVASEQTTVASEQSTDTVNTDSRGIIRKIRTIAREVKDSDINLASIREAKDDFLAFDFEKKEEVTDE